MGFDTNGYPVCLYVRSNGHEPGPRSAPYEWCKTSWNGKYWNTYAVTTSDHNYDMGSLFIEENMWKIVAPTEPGPQEWGVGGELVTWQSTDEGQTWNMENQLTVSSINNHAYARRVVNYQSPFCFFWSNGNAREFSKVELYFGDFSGNVWKLPYEMTHNEDYPIIIK